MPQRRMREDRSSLPVERSVTKRYNLSLEEALVVLHEQVEKNRTQTETGELTRQLQGMSVDEAYDVGYETLLRDLESLTGPDPFEVIPVYISPEGEQTPITEENN